MHPRIGITLGDPAGVGPEIIRAALASGQLPRDIDYKVIGQVGAAVAGTSSPDSARAAFGAMEEAARLAKSGEIDAVVTGPIHKARMAEIGFEFPGQTEFFAARSNTKNFAMLLTGGGITVALVTTHVPWRIRKNRPRRNRNHRSRRRRIEPITSHFWPIPFSFYRSPSP